MISANTKLKTIVLERITQQLHIPYFSTWSHLFLMQLVQQSKSFSSYKNLFFQLSLKSSSHCFFPWSMFTPDTGPSVLIYPGYAYCLAPWPEHMLESWISGTPIARPPAPGSHKVSLVLTTFDHKIISQIVFFCGVLSQWNSHDIRVTTLSLVKTESQWGINEGRFLLFISATFFSNSNITF